VSNRFSSQAEAAFIIITVKPCLLSSWADYSSLSSRPISFGRRRKLPEPYVLMAQSHACSPEGRNLFITVQSQPTFGGGEEVIVSFLYAPSLNLSALRSDKSGPHHCSVFGPCQDKTTFSIVCNST